LKPEINSKFWGVFFGPQQLRMKQLLLLVAVIITRSFLGIKDAPY
jgi:hypothetical protein